MEEEASYRQITGGDIFLYILVLLIFNGFFITYIYFMMFKYRMRKEIQSSTWNMTKFTLTIIVIDLIFFLIIVNLSCIDSSFTPYNFDNPNYSYSGLTTIWTVFYYSFLAFDLTVRFWLINHQYAAHYNIWFAIFCACYRVVVMWAKFCIPLLILGLIVFGSLGLLKLNFMDLFAIVLTLKNVVFTVFFCVILAFGCVMVPKKIFNNMFPQRKINAINLKAVRTVDSINKLITRFDEKLVPHIVALMVQVESRKIDGNSFDKLMFYGVNLLKQVPTICTSIKSFSNFIDLDKETFSKNISGKQQFTRSFAYLQQQQEQQVVCFCEQSMGYQKSGVNFLDYSSSTDVSEQTVSQEGSQEEVNNQQCCYEDITKKEILCNFEKCSKYSNYQIHKETELYLHHIKHITFRLSRNLKLIDNLYEQVVYFELLKGIRTSRWTQQQIQKYIDDNQTVQLLQNVKVTRLYIIHHKYFEVILYFSLFCLALVLSFLVCYHEVLLVKMDDWSKYSLFYISKNDESQFFMVYVITVLLFAFTISGLKYMQIGNFYMIVENNGTDIKSFCFHIQRIVSMSLIICYNVSVLYQVGQKTAQNEVLGVMDRVPLFGLSLMTYLPASVPVFALIFILRLDRLPDLCKKQAKVFVRNKTAKDLISMQGGNILKSWHLKDYEQFDKYVKPARQTKKERFIESLFDSSAGKAWRFRNCCSCCKKKAKTVRLSPAKIHPKCDNASKCKPAFIISQLAELPINKPALNMCEIEQGDEVLQRSLKVASSPDQQDIIEANL